LDEKTAKGSSWTKVFQGLGKDWGHHTGQYHQPSVVSTLADGDIDNSAKEKLKQLEVSPLDKYNTTLLENVHPLKWKDPEPDGR